MLCPTDTRTLLIKSHHTLVYFDHGLYYILHMKTLLLLLLLLSAQSLRISGKESLSLKDLFSRQEESKSRILQEGWLKMVSTHWLAGEDGSELPSSFEVNPAFQSDKSIPKEEDFYVYLFKNTIYVLRKKVFDMVNVYKSIEIA